MRRRVSEKEGEGKEGRGDGRERGREGEGKGGRMGREGEGRYKQQRKGIKCKRKDKSESKREREREHNERLSPSTSPF